jgi:predicted Zn-dependent protease
VDAAILGCGTGGCIPIDTRVFIEGGSVMTRQEAESLLSRIVNRSRVDEIFVMLRSTRGSTIRFADSVPMLPSSLDDTTVQISLRRGGRYATSSCNEFTDAAIDLTLERIEAILPHMPETDRIVPFPASRLVLEAPLLAQRDGDIDPAWRASAVAAILDTADASKLSVTGSLSTSDSVMSIATSNGLFLYQPSSLVQGELRAYSRDGRQTSSARMYRRSTAEFDAAALIKKVRECCLLWNNPVDIKPERTTTVFAAQAVADLLMPLLQQFSMTAIQEDRSFLRRLDGSSFVGARMFHESIRMRSDPFAPELPSMPFTAEGSEVRAATWVNNGVIETLAENRYDTEGTDRDVRPLPTNLLMDGGGGTVDDLIKGTKRGLFVNGFASLSLIDPKNCLLSGSTRDGVFLIENGKITRPVKNLVLRETPVYLLKEVLAMAAPEDASPSALYFPMRIPAMCVKDVMYTQLSGVI